MPTSVSTTVEADSLFDTWVEPWLLGDAKKTIEAGADYTAALALLTYTEILGGLWRGRLGIKGKGETGDNFLAGLDLLEAPNDKDYYKAFRVRLADKPGSTPRETDIYEVFRCGLVHEYFCKGFGKVHNKRRIDNVNDEDKGIGWIDENGKKVLRFHTNAYYRDLNAAVARFRKQVYSNEERSQKFMTAVNRVKDRQVTPV